NPTDLDEAVSLRNEALRLCPVPRGISWAILDLAFAARFSECSDKDDNTRAISLCREAVTLRPPGHPHRATTLSNIAATVGNIAMVMFRRGELYDIEVLNEAIDQHRGFLQVLELDHPERHVTLFNLSSVLCSRFTHTRKNEDIEEAIDLCQQSLEALPSLYPGQMQLHVPYVVAIYLQAVELMEQGRGQQWSLLAKFSELNRCLAGAQGSAGSTDRAAADCAATEYRKLTGQWEAAMVEIRNIQGFSRFLLPPAYEDLQAAARHGPVIIPIASQYSCGAIIVPTSGEPHHVPLPSIALADLNNLKEGFTRAIRNASRMKPTQPRNELIVLLRIVWNEIMLPVVNVLENVLKLNCRSRIWLCPTAAFTSIPLHAANPFLIKADHSKEPCLEDLYVCSYTPTLSALVRSRQTMKKRVTPSFVTIGQGQPGAGKGKALSAVDSELELVHKLVPATASHTTISGNAATRAGALKALETNTWVHLACHGKQDPAQPYHSHFVMRDEHVTLLDIMERNIPRAEFAFLSACHTAVGDKETPDEVIHLAAGLQFAGFKSVVGTLWEVDDAVAKHVVEAFYKYMFHPKEEGVMDCTKAAWALNCATHSVKTKVPLEQRMVFVHIGV
ncbi:CHAT domain-containing protein, partial [Suillus occidentalis]